MSTVTVRYGGKSGMPRVFDVADDLLAVRTRSRNELSLTPLAANARRVLDGFRSIASFHDAGVSVLQTIAPIDEDTFRDARKILAQQPTIAFAGKMIRDSGAFGEPVVYTENVFVKFVDDAAPAACQAVLEKHGLSVKRKLGYAKNAYFATSPADTGLRVFEISEAVLVEDLVELAHPEIVRHRSHRVAFPQQWHLRKATIGGKLVDAHASVEIAWEISQGDDVTIAIIDDGVDIDHEELATSGKILKAYDTTSHADDPRPRFSADKHGTACAGVACAAGRRGAAGVAPRARLMPIRLGGGLGSQEEADAFYWAARNGADVISCSWGPQDGRWWDPNDRRHQAVVAVPDSTRLAIDFALEAGRQGKGCVIVWAAGNGNESVDNDGYASYPGVIAVAACNDRGMRSAYSDHGKAVHCAFPSNDGEPSLTPGIWTIDRTRRAGYNRGSVLHGDSVGNYTSEFGGTSSAAPGVAGVVALVLAKTPGLRRDEVREILRRSCDMIDPEGGQYVDNHSPYYGYGRLNARKAVENA